MVKLLFFKVLIPPTIPPPIFNLLELEAFTSPTLKLSEITSSSPFTLPAIPPEKDTALTLPLL